MIKPTENLTQKRAKAVGLLSGGLDSSLAAKIVTDLGVEVYGVCFLHPWGCCDKDKAAEIAHRLGIKFTVLQLDERYLNVIHQPKHGYGTALNPCVDCRVHMFSRAKKFMDSIGADFVFTGEVLGQRPMSQMQHSMAIIEEESGLSGRLLRPLCAKVLKPTIPEEEGLIDRSKLLDITGRSRKEQHVLAQRYQINDHLSAAGGCLLTDKNFGRRMKDTLQYGYRNFRETTSLKWGRHFRIDAQFKAILGRDDRENDNLKRYAHRDDFIFEFEDSKPGPTAILKGYQPNQAILETVGGLMRKFSKYQDIAELRVNCWPASDEGHVIIVPATVLSEEQIEKMRI